MLRASFITVVPVLLSAAPISVINDALSKKRADYISEKLIECGADGASVSKVFAGGIEEFSPNEANRHTRVVLSYK